LILGGFLPVDSIFSGKISVIDGTIFVLGLGIVMTVAILYFQLLFQERDEIKCFCPRCGKFISSETEWICGYCDFHNKDRWEPTFADLLKIGITAKMPSHSFLSGCVKCHKEPDCLICPHCQKLSAISSQRNEKYAARIYQLEKPKETVEESRQRRDLEKELKLHDITVTRLDLELAELDKEYKRHTAEPKRKKTLEEDLDESAEHVLSVHELYEKKRMKAREIWRENPDLLERVELFLGKWRDDHLE
jgi:ribosomal protein S27AE